VAKASKVNVTFVGSLDKKIVQVSITFITINYKQFFNYDKKVFIELSPATSVGLHIRCLELF
jgi:hypothetical protein